VRARRGRRRVRRGASAAAARKPRFSVAFEQFLELLDAFVRDHGDASVLYADHVGNFPLGHRATYYRSRYRLGFLSPEQVRILDDQRRFRGWAWRPLEKRFAEGLSHLERFVMRVGHARVPPNHVEGRFRLGAWVSRRRREHRAGSLPAAQVRSLERVRGWTWKPADERFPEALRCLDAFVSREGHARVPAAHVEGGFRLGTWVSHRRRDRRKGVLDPRWATRLECLPGWTWDVRRDEFERAFALLRRFVRRTGHALVRQKHAERGFPLGAWVARLRLRRRAEARGRLAPEEVYRLESLPGWTWGRPRRLPNE
jgi:hypothetical protein